MIICPNCQHKNPESAKFCENCGSILSRACPSCGSAVSLGAKFCGNCGYKLEGEEDPQLARLKKLVPKELAERLLRSRGGKVERERRVVTILFSDVKGSTTLSEERDPEQVLEIMNGAFEVLIEPIYRYEGTLARLMGDAILAFFGAPIAHEDDPVRAVLAALDIQKQMPQYAARVEKKYGAKGFAVRVGINTGLVVVGEVGSDLRVEYTAMGDAINVASRLENAAAPGSIVISENTARLARHAFQMESLGGLELKGKAEPVQAYRVTGRKETPESARGIQGLYSPLVGRDGELETLSARLEQLGRGQGQIVSIIGEAGLGKSRLLEEARRFREGKMGDGRTPIKWLEGRSLSYQTSTPYAPFVDLLDQLFDLRREEKDLDKYERIKSTIGRLLPGRERDLAPFIAVPLGIELSGEDLDRLKYLMPPELPQRVFRAVAEVLERLGETQPLVLVFEDLHWADATSLELIESLMSLAERAGVALIALFRPQRQDPSWRFHEVASRDFHHRYTSIQLEPLDEEGARRLVANLLEIEDLPERVRALILKKAEGNPFFVEEVIRSLLDGKQVVREESHWRATREIANIQVPDTLAAVITARLDGLDDDSKRTAQTAAVVGREFQFDVLADVSELPQTIDPALTNLERREIVRLRSRLPQRLYLFKHSVTQETAYATILMSKRKEIHRRVAECMERVEPERVNDIAWHFLEAKEESRALPYLIAAGDLAARAYSAPEAIRAFTQAVEIAKSGENRSLARRAYEGLGNVQSFAFNIPAAVQTFEEMDEWGRAHDDVPMQVSAINKLAYNLAFFSGQFPTAEKHLADAERLAQAAQDKPGLVEAYFVRCGMCTAMGDFDRVLFYMGQSAEFGRELNLQDQVAASLDHTARAHMLLTRFDEAWVTAQEALDVAREIKNRDVESAVLTTIAALYLRKGDLDSAQHAAEEAAEIALRIGAMVGGIAAPWTLGAILRLRGEYEGAISSFQQSVQRAYPMESTLGYLLALPLASLGSTYFEISTEYAPRVMELHSHALEILKRPTGEPAAGSSLMEVGFTALGQNQVEEAEEAFQRALDTPSMYRYFFRPQSQIGLGLVALRRNRIEESAQLIADAREYSEQREMKNLYPLNDYAEAQVRFAGGERERALELFGRAESSAFEMKMRPMVLQARLGAARVLMAMGRGDEANEKRRKVHDVVDEITGLIRDQEMRAAFVENAKRLLAMDG
jgi:class 3 adenylate cyclase/tetratricopeptide (TPR) repeat protein